MYSIYELTDEISVIGGFIRDLEEQNELNSPIKEIIFPVLIKRLKFLTKELNKISKVY